MVTIDVPSNYGLVLLSVVSTFITGSYLGMRVGSFRKAAQVPYPFEYASYEQVHSASTPERKAKLLAFNAAQRGHQNFNENHLNMVGSLLVCGLVHPKVAASLGAFWSVNRVLYAVGYTNWGKDGKGSRRLRSNATSRPVRDPRQVSRSLYDTQKVPDQWFA
ncbi:hypothetical protein GRF29_28g1844831 [Pseudopithomyces chartarum]|uniref:Membrane-associated proteins in eicosanoid and glutathione metabolism n=1 Tax=Pseudopithomyces chartarum TaxID=1892770 RepID=A0AAN6M350_9PLEO|nr:hypothetical protein GRF29_28g1844831 [Pseudopithomyces chartarum]